jgi:hypothetical protein
MELEALCKRLREDTQKLREQKATLEGMVESRDEWLMEMAEEMDSTAWERMMRMRMMTMKGTSPHPLHLHHLLPRLRRSLKRKPPWRWFSSKKPLWHMR